MIGVDAVWLACEPLDMHAGTESALGRVVNVFGEAHPHHAYLFANRRANRMSVLVHDGIAYDDLKSNTGEEREQIAIGCLPTIKQACAAGDAGLPNSNLFNLQAKYAEIIDVDRALAAPGESPQRD